MPTGSDQKASLGKARATAAIRAVPYFTPLDRLAVASHSELGCLFQLAFLIATLIALIQAVRSLSAGEPSFIFWFIAITIFFLPLSALEKRRVQLWATYESAVDANALEAVKTFRTLLGGKRSAYSRRSWLRLDGDEAFMDGQWHKASELYAELRKSKSDRAAIGDRYVLAMAMDGHTHEVVEAARASFAAANGMRRQTKREKRARAIMMRRARRSLGAVLSLAGEHREALDILMPLTSAPRPELPRYFLGASLMALGRVDEATTLLRENARGDSKWAKLSRELLTKLGASPHR
jgi:hypothetical protein